MMHVLQLNRQEILTLIFQKTQELIEVAHIGINGVGQIIVFAIFTIISLLLVRPTALKYLHRGEDNRISNADAIIGRTGIVSETIIKGGYGRVAIDGDDWKAQSTETENVEKGEKVIVESRDSIIITVKRA